MNANQKTCKTRCTYLMPIAALVLGLAACDSGNESKDSASSSVSRQMLTGPAQGILTDAAISGVSYTASSGKTGVTSDEGIFDYDHGDSVEFKLGKLTLGNVKGAPIVTPIELADGDNNKLQNLLVLLQSLDADGVPANGISIPEDAAAAVDASINLTSNPDTFAETSGLQNVLEAGGISGVVKTVEEASDHFLAQGVNLLGAHIWVRYDDQSANIIRIAADGSGEYLQGQASPDDSCDENRVCGGRTIIQAGVEYGIVNASEFDTRGFKLVGATTIDTNLKAGLSHPGPTRRFHTDGYDLIASDMVTVQREREQKSVFNELFNIAAPIELSSDDEVVEKEVKESRYGKMDNDSSGIVGAWVLDEASIDTKTLLFFPNKKFILVDPTGDTYQSEESDCGKPGVEFASYSYNAGSNALQVSSFIYDTNGCVGFSGKSGNSITFNISADGNTAELASDGETVVTLYRASS